MKSSGRPETVDLGLENKLKRINNKGRIERLMNKAVNNQQYWTEDRPIYAVNMAKRVIGEAVANPDSENINAARCAYTLAVGYITRLNRTDEESVIDAVSMFRQLVDEFGTQEEKMIDFIRNGGALPPIDLQRLSDGYIVINNGHH